MIQNKNYKIRRTTTECKKPKTLYLTLITINVNYECKTDEIIPQQLERSLADYICMQRVKKDRMMNIHLFNVHNDVITVDFIGNLCTIHQKTSDVSLEIS